MKDFTNIPVSLIQYALVNRKINHLKLYIHLKLKDNGYVVYNNHSCKIWAEEIGIHEKTVKSSLDWLIAKKWVTGNKKRCVLRIISYRNLSLKLDLSLKTGYLFEPENYKNFKALCCAVVICYYLCKKRYFNRRSGNIKGFPITNSQKSNGFYPMANGYLANCLNVSISTACRYKQEAEETGYIKTKRNLSFLEDRSGNRAKSECFEVAKYVNNLEGLPNRIRKGKKYLKQVEADLIHSYIKCKKKQYETKGKK